MNNLILREIRVLDLLLLWAAPWIKNGEKIKAWFLGGFGRVNFIPPFIFVIAGTL